MEHLREGSDSGYIWKVEQDFLMDWVWNKSARSQKLAWVLSDEKDGVAAEIGKTSVDRCQEESQELRFEH